MRLVWILVAVACDSGEPARVPEPTPLPQEPAVVVWTLSGGFAGEQQITRIWADGTIAMSGMRCNGDSGPRTKATPQQVATLLADIKATGFMTATLKEPHAGADMFRISVRVVIDGEMKTLVHEGPDGPDALERASALVIKLAGHNPC